MSVSKPLSGVKIIEIEGIGPGPFCGMHLADLGADVTAVVRPGPNPLGKEPIIRRGKTIVPLNLKSNEDRDQVLDMLEDADGLIEGMRPGVMERLGLGPEDVARVNPALCYGRLTGWGQDGPLSQAAGHDINYLALSGALWFAGEPGTAPRTPPTMIGDIAGGALYLALGLVSSILQAKISGKGAVIDAAMVDGSAHMMNLILAAREVGIIADARGTSVLDSAPWYGCYACADGEYISIGPLEPQFYVALLAALDMTADTDMTQSFSPADWPAMREKLTAAFAAQPRTYWCEKLEGTDVCFAPVLSPAEAAAHPHMQARNIYKQTGHRLEARPAPRFAPLTPED